MDSFHALVAALAEVEAAGDERVRIDQLAALERVKGAASAAQARITDEIVTSGLDAAHGAGAGASRAGEEAGARRSIGAQVALARRESPHRGRRLTHLAVALLHDLPETLAALERGDINEHRAQLIADGTRDLGADERRSVDSALAERLAFLGDREVRLATAREAMRVDPEGVAERRETAQSRRRISGRWLGDGTGLISAVVSDVHYAAIMTSLRQAADADRARGDDRTREQLVADHFVSRLTGQVTAQRVPVALGLVISAEALLGADDEPAEVTGYGPIPASVARGLAATSPEQGSRIRRLFRVDDTDHLVAMESTSRTFDGLLREFILLRDQLCRTPWCGGQIRAGDHVRSVASGGATSTHNGQGLCEDCNLTKETPGWRHEVWSGPYQPHVVAVTTPTGQVHRSRAPNLPRARLDWIETRPGLWQRAA